MTRRRALRWVVALVFAMTVAATSDFGPILVTLPGYYHGVHLGDLLAVAMGAVWVVFGDPARTRRRDADDAD